MEEIKKEFKKLNRLRDSEDKIRDRNLFKLSELDDQFNKLVAKLIDESLVFENTILTFQLSSILDWENDLIFYLRSDLQPEDVETLVDLIRPADMPLYFKGKISEGISICFDGIGLAIQINNFEEFLKYIETRKLTIDCSNIQKLVKSIQKYIKNIQREMEKEEKLIKKSSERIDALLRLKAICETKSPKTQLIGRTDG